jgi:hypothetical protein
VHLTQASLINPQPFDEIPRPKTSPTSVGAIKPFELPDLAPRFRSAGSTPSTTDVVDLYAHLGGGICEMIGRMDYAALTSVDGGETDMRRTSL